MNVVDYVILGILGVSLLFGLYRGFVSSVLNTGGCLLSFGLSLALAILVTYAVEKPAARLIDKLRAKRNHAE